MASKTESLQQSKGYTAPKGRPTVHNTGEVAVSRISPTMEWVIAGIILVIVLAAIFYFGADFRAAGGGHGGGGHTGAGLPASLDALSQL